MKKDMLTGSPIKIIAAFSVPMIIGNLFQQLYNMIDSVIVGKFVSANALGAIRACFSTSFLIISLLIGLTTGVSVIIAQCFGAKKFNDLKKTVYTSIIFMSLVSLILSIIGLIVSKPFLELLQTPPQQIADATSYLQITFIGLIFTCLYNVFAGILRGIGDSKTPLYFLVLSSIINIILDLVFILNFHMGVSGAAWATILSQFVSAILCGVYMFVKTPILRIDKKSAKIEKHIIINVCKYGIPTGLQQSFVSVGMMAVQGLVNSFGASVTSAYGAAANIETLALMPPMTFSTALSTFVGQNIAAQKMDRVKQGFKATIILSCSTAILFTIITLLFKSQLVSLFFQKGEDLVVSIGSEYLVVVSIFFIVMGYLFSLLGLLRGAGDATATMVCSFIELIFRVGLAYLLTYTLASVAGFKYYGIWLSRPIGWIVVAILLTIRYKSGKWKNKALFNSNTPKENNKTIETKN